MIDSVVETQVEEFGYPNTDINGYLQYDSTHYLNKKDALECAISNIKCCIKMYENIIKKGTLELNKSKAQLKCDKKQLIVLQKQLMMENKN
jgi:hypothetical protein